MEYEANGLMATNAPLIKRTPVLTEFLNSLAPQQAQTLEQQLAGMTESDRAFLMTMAKMVQLSMQMRIGSGDQSQGYYDLVTQMYGKVSPTKRRLVAEILDASSPLDFEPTPKKSQADAAMSFYEKPEMQVSPRSEPSQADDETASALEAVLAEVFPEPQRKPASQPSKVAVGKEAFLAAYTPVAKEVAKDLGVSHRIVLAQAALESGWGKSVKGNGLMGIKSHGEDGGLDVITHEVVNGKRVKITDSFRQYDSPEDSIRGYGSFLKANSRYKHFLRAGTENEDAQLSALQSSGYASDPKYAFKLRNIMNGLPDEQGET
ncbi:glucosaminidase domain-containing protein [bacterium]|nr:glucosaminidase domain-containing protein [Planktomarina temperata]MDA9892228.1 glucosaminidase domain-containing protein [Planktomarina temperata]MDA9937856.1 glucosaminidase domain-containing protein [bacterium]MDC3221693.1 glucosaminidase domain-containing protein [Planktomarina sp.]